MNPLVSVIINCFNGEKYLSETLNSVLAQTYANWELIFWDNCSTDSTPNIVKGCNDSRIKYYRANVKTTLGQARNLAMEKAQGQLIAFIDADDVWMPDYLRVCVNKIKENSAAVLVYVRFINFDGGNEWLSPGGDLDKRIPINSLISSYGIGMSGALFSRSAKEDNNVYIDERFSLIEDFDFFIHLASCGEVYYISNPLMRYRWNASGLTQNSKWATEYKMLYEKVKYEDNLKSYRNDIRKCYEFVQTRDLLLSGQRGKALLFICKSVCRNPAILRYLFPVIFGMENFHKLRMMVSRM